jgi:hypothetical protein
MATVQISDGINPVVNLTPNDDSAFVKYFKNLSKISINGALLALRQGLTLDDPVITSVNVGADFSQPVDLGMPQLDLEIGAGLSGSITIFKPDGVNTNLFDPDPYLDPVTVDTNDRYVSFGLTGSVKPSLTATSGQLEFGFAGGVSVTIANYRRFSIKPVAPQLLDAIKDTLTAFTIPDDVDDLQALSTGSIVTMNGSGSLKFSGQANLLAAVNPLASATLPSPLPSVSLQAGGSVIVGVDVELSGEYQIRIFKIADNQVRLAFYRKSGTSFDVTVSASEGISGNIGDTDYLSKIVSAVSSDGDADADELKKAGLTTDQISGIQDAIQASIERSVEIAVTAELGGGEEQTAAFVYDLTLSAMSQAAKDALRGALHGNLSDLTAASSPMPGVAVVRDIFTNVRERKHSLSINLLGILNYGTVSKLVLAGKTLYEPATGQLVISDTATASRVTSTVLNIGVADSDKLRQVMAENFLLTIAYRGARNSGLAAELATTHSFFALNDHTTQETLRDELDVSVALGLVTSSNAAQMVGRSPDFGRTMFYARTAYDKALASQLFLNGGGQPRDVASYEAAGLAALACLIHAGDNDDARLRPTQNPALWQKMKDLGQPSISSLFPGVSAPVVAAIVTDYTCIRWWADAMNATAQKLAKMDVFLASHPTADDTNSDFTNLRSDLANHLRSVAANTRTEFGRPWGLLAMYIVSGKKAGRKTVLVGPKLSLTEESPIVSA